MLNRIRSARKAKNMTLVDVAKRCNPPTTAQTIGRLETGARTLSLDWLNRIAEALSVDSADLIQLPDQQSLDLVAIYGQNGAYAPKKAEQIVVHSAPANMIAMRMNESVGDYRFGDEIWLEKMPVADSQNALNMDILVPRPDGRFIFGRLIGREDERIQILPLGAGTRQQIVKSPMWIARVRQLVRTFS